MVIFLGVVLTRFFSPRAFRLWIPKRCKGVHCVDLGESFPTSIYLQNLASIKPRTSLVKFARSPLTDLTTDLPGATQWPSCTELGSGPASVAGCLLLFSRLSEKFVDIRSVL